jgi:hypothetical protein
MDIGYVDDPVYQYLGDDSSSLVIKADLDHCHYLAIAVFNPNP